MVLMQSPLVTVIIASYQHCDFVIESIQSVIDQDYPNIELIVIDDGSTDDSVEIIQQLAAQYSFTFRYRENRGLAETLNEALAMAGGKYICQLGSDDVMLPGKTRRQVEFMEREPGIAVSGGNAEMIDGKGRIIATRKPPPGYREISFENLFAETGPGIFASSAMIRKSVLDELGGWNADIQLEDMYMWFKVTSRGYRMVGLGENLIKYRIHGDNTYKKAWKMYSALLKTIEDYKSHPLYQQVYAKHTKSYFIRASKTDRESAKKILSNIPLSSWDLKITRAVVRTYLGI